MAIYRGPGGAGDATGDATNASALALAAKDAAQASATSAASSATAAANSATAADTSADSASTSATNASGSASTASTAATNASNSASDASDSADAAASSASDAADSATAAASSATSASTDASTATTQASNASSSASSASTSAATATTKASEASTSATNAASSATTASTAATNASNSASAAATSETNAASSASSASTSASNASTSASTATTQATNAASSASAASTSASNAATSATNAQTAETNAETAQAAAESARDATLAAYDSFDDRYLGAKVADPVLDNDGNALAAGELYFNTISNSMKVYTGTLWVDSYADGNTLLAKAANLSDLANVATARTNLGLGTVATTAATDYVAVTGDQNIAGAKKFTGSVIVGRVNSASEGGQLDFCRSSDDASSWAIDVYGSTSTPSLRIVDNVASATRMAIDGSGNVGIGTSSPASKFDVIAATNSGIRVSDGTYTGTFVPSSLGGMAITTGGAYPLIYYINGAERARIDSSGNLLVGRTSTGFDKTAYGWQFSKDGESFGTVNTASALLTLNRNNTGDVFKFFRDGTQRGWISVETTGTTYGNLSDRREKQNFADAPEALSKLNDLQVQSFDWKAGGHTEYGFVAQDLYEILPFAVTAGDNGETVEKPWGIDNSKIVPFLVKAIQEQQAIIQTLTSRIEALENKQ